MELTSKNMGGVVLLYFLMSTLLTKSKDLLTHKLTTILKNEKISPKSWNKVTI